MGERSMGRRRNLDHQASNESCLLNCIACLSAFFTQSLRRATSGGQRKEQEINWLEKAIESCSDTSKRKKHPLKYSVKMSLSYFLNLQTTTQAYQRCFLHFSAFWRSFSRSMRKLTVFRIDRR